MIPKINKGNTVFNIIYISDPHAKATNVRHLKMAVDAFSRENPTSKTLKLAGGDLNFASDLEPNVLMLKLMDLIGLDASSVGNHEIEGGNYWAKAIEVAKAKFKFLSANLNFSRANAVQNKITKSTIIELDGEKVGLIGLSPFRGDELNFKSDFNDYVSIKDFSQSVKDVREEVEKLERKGINKIVLLAHTGRKSPEGFHYYKNLAKIGGIDIIIGGHDHRQYSRWFISERGEPVKVVSTEAANDINKESEDLGTFGILKAVFNSDGVLIPKKCKNRIKKTKDYPASLEVQALEEKILQNNKVICHASQSLECNKRKTQENPVADLLADSMLWISKKLNPQSKAQIALINSGEIKADIQRGDITTRVIRDAFPFTHNVTIVETKLTKKQLFDALNWGVETTTFPKQTLGLLQVGGLRYTVGSNNQVKNVYLIDKYGKLGECLDKMPDAKEYTVIYDTYLMNGSGGMSSLKKEPNAPDVKIYPYNHQSGVIKYLKEYFKNKPVEVKTGRIEIEPKNLDVKEKELVTTH